MLAKIFSLTENRLVLAVVALQHRVCSVQNLITYRPSHRHRTALVYLKLGYY